MAALAIGGPRTDSIPGPGARISPTHPLSQGLILCCPMPWYDIARGNPITPNDPLIPYGTHNYGLGATVTSAQQFSIADEPFLHTLTEFSVVGWGVPSATTAILLTRDDVSNWGIALYIATSGGATFQVKTNSGIVGLASSSAPAGVTTMAAGTFKAGSVVVYQDGTRKGSSAIGGTYVDNAAQPFIIGRSPLFAGGAAATIGSVMVWNRALTHGEIQELHATPFCMVASA